MASIYASLASLLFNDKYSDLTITCRGRTFKVHRAVVCPQVAFFAKACDGSFKESISGVVDLPDDDPYILERFLQFLYTGTYGDSEYPVLDGPSPFATMTPEEAQEELDRSPGIQEEEEGEEGDKEWYERGGEENKDEDDDDDEEEEEGEGEEEEEDTEWALPQSYRIDWPHSLFTSLHIYVMADKFDVPALKLLARQRFYRTAERIYATCEDFPAVVDEMYRTTAPNDLAMREIPCRLIATQYSVVRERFEPIIREHGDLAIGILNYMTYLLGLDCPHVSLHKGGNKTRL